NLIRKKGIIIDILIAPEHGIYGYQNEFDKNTYIHVKQLNAIVYNMHKMKGRELLNISKKSDIIIYDIQDMGMRCFTYISNLKRIMDILKGTKRELIVLDRPNPLSYLGTDGPYLDDKFRSAYVSAFPSPFIYNMTIGESALYYKGEFLRDIKLRVIKMENYSRSMFFHETELPWVPPSPNLPTYMSSIVYSAVVLFEGTNISIGRGTPKPFEFIGAPWIDPVVLARDLQKIGFKNFRFRPLYYMPSFSLYKGVRCGGVQIFYTGGKFSPTEFSYKLMQHIFKKYKKAIWKQQKGYYRVDFLAGTDKFRKSITQGKTYKEFLSEIKGAIDTYEKKRKKYLIY
ncbi:MAG: DUF1343 domain-containing protein, partial [Candidatus Heimdallarchaeota archaeon]|nr:DUF1343 domain-containing protein [Candidatus Heimdallarchaeota archaeon]